MLEKAAEGLSAIDKEQFAYVGTLELITGVITFLGIMYALNYRLVREYQTVLDNMTKKQGKMLEDMHNLAVKGKHSVEDAEQYAYHEGERERVWQMKRDMSSNHQLILILEIFVLVGYGLALLSEQLPYSVFVTIVVMGIAMFPSVAYTVRHRRNLQKLAKQYPST